MKNQANCGSCWVSFLFPIFSRFFFFEILKKILKKKKTVNGSIAPLEGQWAISTHEPPVLSRPQRMDCNTAYPNACCGGWPHYLAAKFTGASAGYHLEADYPYVEGSKGSTMPACSQDLHACQSHTVRATITGYDRPVLSGTEIIDYLYKVRE